MKKQEFWKFIQEQTQVIWSSSVSSSAISEIDVEKARKLAKTLIKSILKRTGRLN